MKKRILKFLGSKGLRIYISKHKLAPYKDFGGPLPDGVEYENVIILHPGRGRGIFGFLDTVLHEILHKLEPEWSETVVRTETRKVKKHLTFKDKQEIFADVFTKAQWRK